MTRAARQVDYDHLVSELVGQGTRWEDAVQEVDETFLESKYDLSTLFRYQNEEEFKQKLKAEGYLRMFEQLMLNQDTTSVNLVFGIQGLTQNMQLRSNESVRVGTLRLIEQKGTFSTLIKVLGSLAGTSEDGEDGEEDDEDAEDEDEDENNVLQKLHILTFTSLLVQYPREEFLDYESLFILTEETAPILKAALDADCGEARYLKYTIQL